MSKSKVKTIIICFFDGKGMAHKCGFVLYSICLLTLSISMLFNQCGRYVDMSHVTFFSQSTCQADWHSIGFYQIMPTDKLQSGCMLIGIDAIYQVSSTYFCIEFMNLCEKTANE